MRTVIKYGLQPTLLILVLAIWYFSDNPGLAFLATGFFIPTLLTLLERWVPGRPEWKQPLSYSGVLAVVFIVTFLFTGTIVEPIYQETVNPMLTELRTTLGFDLWPHNWPVLAQVFLAFFMSEFIWYWIHRAEHRWHWAWRTTGHGAHHAFKNLAALNAGANHPLELLLVLSLPAAIIELLFGAGDVIVGSILLVLTQALLAHSNLDLNTRGIGWLFTVNRHHIHHHSTVLSESNTNYGCAAIVWDRLFGTFSDAATEETGTGPSQPGWWRLFIMPWREPSDTQVSPSK